MTRLIAATAIALLPACAHTNQSDMSQTPRSGLHHRTITIDGVDHRYAIYVPRDLDPSSPTACVIFLNGRGECGTDGTKQLAVGLFPAVMLDAASWPCILLFPQKPDPRTQWEDHEPLVLGVLDRARKEFMIDPARIALTGLSQGGHGTWVIGGRHPDLFSKLAPICGYGDAPSIAAGVSGLPVRAFHGMKDNVVPASMSQSIIDAIRALNPNADVTLTLYPEADHNSWDRAYRDEKLGAWLTSPR
ncbi:MAG: dienelactone hydrolase family protein [Phycisphaerales bacterium]